MLGWCRGGAGQDHTEALGGQWLLLRGPLPPLPQGGHLPMCMVGRRGKSLPRVIYGRVSGTIKSPARGGVGTEGLEAPGPGGAAGVSSFPPNLAVLGAGQAACVYKLPGAPGGTWSSFLVCLGSRVQS